MNRPYATLSFVVLVSLLTLAACQPIQAPTSESEAPATAATSDTTTRVRTSTFDATKYENVWVQAIEEFENEGRSLLRISYPVTEHDAINARMEAVTQVFIDEYRTIAAETEKSYQEEGGATFVTHYRQHFDVAIANENLIFFDIVRSIDTGGTGQAFVVGYIFDRRNGAGLAIPDLFVDDSYLERLSALTREALAERVSKEELASDLEWVESGTAPTAENFNNILFREDGTVLVMFDKYQVAAGVAGVVEVSLPVAAIADLLKPEIRDLLGVQAEAATLRTEFAKALANVRAASQPNSPAVVRAFSPAVVQSNLLAVVQASSAEEDEINCYEVACVALTFDDGPSVYTAGLLDILKEHNVKATFFVLGTNVRIQSETLYRTYQEGHEIGNHTWDHPIMTKLSDAQIREQLQLTDNLIAQIIGVPTPFTPFLRPPYGAYDDRVKAVSGLPIIFWTVDPEDWRDRNAEIVAARIIDSPVGAIILAHDIHKSTVDAVPAIIAALKGRGIHFVTVTKLFAPQPLLPGHDYSIQPATPSQ